MQRTDGSTAGYGDDGAAFIASQLFGIHVVVYKVLKHTDVTQKRHRKFFNCACWGFLKTTVSYTYTPAWTLSTQHKKRKIDPFELVGPTF